MQRTEIVKHIKESLVETMNLDNAESISSTVSLKEGLGLDSMSSLTFLMTLEDKIEGFSVNADTLEEEDLDNIDSVADYVEKEFVSE